MIKYSPEIRDRLLRLGFDPNLSHYGLVEEYNPYQWTGYGPQGKGKMRVWLPYMLGKKWRTLDIYGVNIEPNKFAHNQKTLRYGDMVAFDLGFGPAGVTGLKIVTIRQKQRDVDVERTIVKAMNALKEDGYVSPLVISDIVEQDFFGAPMVMSYPSAPLLPEVLPKIEKAPKT